MSTFDFAPFYRLTVGFDRFSLRSITRRWTSVPTYPPYNIQRTDDYAYPISLAVAGFTDADLSIETNENRLTIRGEKQTRGGDRRHALPGHRCAAFERSSQLPTMFGLRARAWRTGSYTSTSCARFPRQ